MNTAGTIDVLPIQASGVPASVSDTLTTVLSDWDQLLAYSIDGEGYVHLYRSSDGFFSLYQVDSAGLISGPVETGFEELGWSGMHSFSTSLP